MTSELQVLTWLVILRVSKKSTQTDAHDLRASTISLAQI